MRTQVVNGVLEPMVSKLKSLKFATEAIASGSHSAPFQGVTTQAAITILRIDDLVRIAPDPQDEQQ